MSTSFNIFPTKKNKPKCDEIIKYSVQLFNEFLRKEKIDANLEIGYSWNVKRWLGKLKD